MDNKSNVKTQNTLRLTYFFGHPFNFDNGNSDEIQHRNLECLCFLLVGTILNVRFQNNVLLERSINKFSHTL